MTIKYIKQYFAGTQKTCVEDYMADIVSAISNLTFKKVELSRFLNNTPIRSWE
jgi:hypothetical protein